MLTLIENGEIFAPAQHGKQSILLAGEKIIKIGQIDRAKLQTAGVDCTPVDASNGLIVPGFIDPHEHLTGAGGEQGYASRQPEVPFEDLVKAGVTSVVGCVGTDTITRTLRDLLAKVYQLCEQGISAYMYTGGFYVPPVTITGSVIDDLVTIERVVGVGELAIADTRSVEPTLTELARLVSAAVVGGSLSGKAGVTHFHVGTGKPRLKILHDLLNQFDIEAHSLYPTHISRSEAHMDEAIALTKLGSFVDVDTVEADLGRWLNYYRAHDGDFARLTVSSDAHTPGGSPAKLYSQFVSAIQEYDFALADVLPLFTRNPATVLKLPGKGEIAPGKDADILILDKATLSIRHVFARGRQLMRDGQIIKQNAGED